MHLGAEAISYLCPRRHSAWRIWATRTLQASVTRKTVRDAFIHTSEWRDATPEVMRRQSRRVASRPRTMGPHGDGADLHVGYPTVHQPVSWRVTRRKLRY